MVSRRITERSLQVLRCGTSSPAVPNQSRTRVIRLDGSGLVKISCGARSLGRTAPRGRRSRVLAIQAHSIRPSSSIATCGPISGSARIATSSSRSFNRWLKTLLLSIVSATLSSGIAFSARLTNWACKSGRSCPALPGGDGRAADHRRPAWRSTPPPSRSIRSACGMNSSPSGVRCARRPDRSNSLSPRARSRPRMRRLIVGCVRSS